MAEKVTTMVLKVVDLKCSHNFEKIKKILCNFPEIRDQVYDEKANTVTVTVVCCDPEKIRDKLCCKGHKLIISIEIKPPPKPAPPKPPTKPPIDPPKPDPPTIIICPVPQPVYPVPTCCGQCHSGHDGGPCQRGCGGPPPQRPPCFEGHYGCGCGCGCGCGRDCRHFSKCDSEENPSSCSVTNGRDCRHFSKCDYYLSEANPSSCSVTNGRDCRHFSNCDYYLSEENPSSCSVM